MDDRIRKSRRQEKQGAERFSGTVTPGSGNQPTKKGDVRTDTELIEFKGTDNKSYSLKLAELLTAGRHALLADKRMVFGIEFWGARKRYVVLEEDDYLADRELMAEAADNLEELLAEKNQWQAEAARASVRIKTLESQLAYALKSVGELLDLT